MQNSLRFFGAISLSLATVGLVTAQSSEADDPFAPFSFSASESNGEASHSAPRGNETAPRCQCAIANYEAEQKILRTLRKPLAEPLEFFDTPLDSALEYLQDVYGISIQIDIDALDDVGIGYNEKLSVNIRNVSLRSALNLMLNQHDLTWVIKESH